MASILQLHLYDDDLIRLGFRFIHNVLFLALVVRLAWHPNSRNHEFVFATVMLNITVFFICFTMKKLELSLGLALGLFAIFGVLRYRTAVISTKDMTYLFVVIGIAVINALSNEQTSYIELLAVNSVLLFAAMVGEWLIGRVRGQRPGIEAETTRERRHRVTYDKLELLAPERHRELLADLRARIHLPIARVRVERVDLIENRATLSVWAATRDDAGVE